MAPHRVLLTGANGYIASHILSQLLSASHSVRAVVRSQSKVESVRSLFPASSSQLDFAIVPDMTAPGAFDTALQSEPPFDVVLHTASPFLYKTAGSPSDFLEPAIKGTTEILEGVKRVGNSVKRVVITGSFAGVGAFGLRDESNKVYTEADWNPVTEEDLEKAGDNFKGLSYLASKTFAERAAWDIVEKGGKDLGFDVVVLNPPMVYGPLKHKVKSVDELNESTAQIYNKFIKDKKPEDSIPTNGLLPYVDVRDISKAHLLAIDTPEAANQRFIITAGRLTNQKIADLLREHVPGAAERVPKGDTGADTLPSDYYNIDNSKGLNVLGIKYRSAEETIGDLGKQLLEIEKGE
ncbi:3-beta hydroxysteroid dehydrogenase/isomerase family protein-like protein [Dendryphion nanum]|uniref:3-beta hydroxysteroid dehydrogenase/isomerase family protein-like protein n=1 Tax=Dendryphion nanum TaxID=256645 RepID=A0A9P9EB18_9PLEO|nr:3-beta hydroxysteroid dehydrogenase/isomerase family protein-like protein [Dendryphion nanum]